MLKGKFEIYPHGASTQQKFQIKYYYVKALKICLRGTQSIV